MRRIAFILLLAALASCTLGGEASGPVGGVQVPSQKPGKARVGNRNGQLSLANDVISMSWNTAGGKLTPLSIADRLHGKTWRQTGCDLFHIARGAAPAEVSYDDLHIGMRIRAGRIDVMVSRDGKSWRNVYQHDVSNRTRLPVVVRVGKMDMKGGPAGDKQRTALAKKMGLISGDKLDLADDAYYRWYRDKCRSLMKDHGVNYFKWDRAGSGASPHFMALLNIARELREVNPNVFINVTVGTWPSPFWLNHIDCTWRGAGGDVGWIGKGDDREQWLTFRDQFCYTGVVSRAPLYPLNSLMHHGLVHGRAFQGARVSKAGSDLKNEARSYFGAGPTMQELYITPSMMTEASWRQVAQAAKWAHANADVLLDTHWVGGVPGKLEAYGYASWSPRKGTLTLRNPDDTPQTFVLDIQKVFELPTEAPRRYQLKNAYPDQKSPETVLTAGKTHTLKLRAFEVLVFDVEPLRK